MAKKILDWNEYLACARRAVAEGVVMLENKNQVLPLKEGAAVSIFGRIQNYYYKSGTGSGGMVNVSKVTNIVEGLMESGVVTVNQQLLNTYKEWEEKHPFDEGEGWGKEPWSQEEMPVSEELVKQAAGQSDTAIVIIGRTAGEDRDNSDTKGAYRLSEVEEDMLSKVRASFAKMVVLLNVGNIIDMNYFDVCEPDAVLYVWQGGMTGGSGTADVLTGKVSPSGKLTDTIACHIEDYPSHDNFGDDVRNFYCEDIYVGYRYFETFAKDKVKYPFGYGLSYTTFSITNEEASVNIDEQKLSLLVKVKNNGDCEGKEVVQIYVEAPQGKLGKASRQLIAFAKTKALLPGEEEEISFSIPFSRFSSYDDSGVTGHAYSYLLEQGSYDIYMGNDVRSSFNIFSFPLVKDIILETVGQALAPVLPFERYKVASLDNGEYEIAKEPVPLLLEMEDSRRLAKLPKKLMLTGDQGIKLSDVLSGEKSMDEFIAQLDEEDLASLIRGEGMGSNRVTAGTAAAFGGVSDHLVSMGIPAVCCDDGPSGMRLDSGAKAFSLPNGTMLGCTFNPDLLEELYNLLGMEMVYNHVECLLGPGMNLHRHPLNGRNFEYFSEDSYLTGVMAIAELKALRNQGVSGTIKHFCANNQEKKRRESDTVVSERALRELYLKGFEMAVKSGYADSIMTTYGALNGLWTAGNYDLATTILREEWGFSGIVMTDWWAAINERNEESNFTNFAAMARSQNDIYMVCPDGSTNSSGDNTLTSLQDGTLTIGELQRNARNILTYVMHSQAMKRLLKTADDVEIINRPADEDDIDIHDLEFTVLEDEITMDLTDRDSKADTNYILALDIKHLGAYEVTLTGSSSLGELAQIPCTLFKTGSPVATFTFHGTAGEEMRITKNIQCRNRFAVMRLYVAKNGVSLKNIHFKAVETGE